MHKCNEESCGGSTGKDTRTRKENLQLAPSRHAWFKTETTTRCIHLPRASIGFWLWNLGKEDNWKQDAFNSSRCIQLVTTMMSYSLKWWAENLVHSSSVGPYMFRRLLCTQTHTWRGSRTMLKTYRNNYTKTQVQRKNTHRHTFWAPLCDGEIVLQKMGFCRAPASELSFRIVAKSEKFTAQEIRRFQHNVHACIWCCCPHLRHAASSLASKVDWNSSLSAALNMSPGRTSRWYMCIIDISAIVGYNNAAYLKVTWNAFHPFLIVEIRRAFVKLANSECYITQSWSGMEYIQGSNLLIKSSAK